MPCEKFKVYWEGDEHQSMLSVWCGELYLFLLLLLLILYLKTRNRRAWIKCKWNANESKFVSNFFTFKAAHGIIYHLHLAAHDTGILQLRAAVSILTFFSRSCSSSHSSCRCFASQLLGNFLRWSSSATSWWFSLRASFYTIHNVAILQSSTHKYSWRPFNITLSLTVKGRMCPHIKRAFQEHSGNFLLK